MCSIFNSYVRDFFKSYKQLVIEFDPKDGESILNSLYSMLDDENVPGTVTTVRIEPR